MIHGKNSGTNDDFFRIVPRTHKYLHNWTRSYIFVMKSSGSMFHIYFFITVSIWVQSGCDRYRHMGVLEFDRYRHLDRIRRHIGYLRSREPISATGGTEIDRYRHLLKYLAAHIGQNRFGRQYRHKTLFFFADMVPVAVPDCGYGYPTHSIADMVTPSCGYGLFWYPQLRI